MGGNSRIDGDCEMIDKKKLDCVYEVYNRREYVHPDPLEFLYGYPRLEDREIVGMVASALAYGRVAQILKSVGTVLDRMTPSPCLFLRESTPDRMAAVFAGFVHRFATGGDLARFLSSLKAMIERYGSLHEGFTHFLRPDHETILPALSSFCEEIAGVARGDLGHLLALPGRGSACKRMNLFLRWMVRNDAVDPGGWDAIPASKLIIPLDIHMHRMGALLGLSERKQADMRTAQEITRGFSRILPEDPVRYDFVLTRFGIRSDMGDAFHEFKKK